MAKKVLVFVNGGSGPHKDAGPADQVARDAGQIFSLNEWLRQMVGDPETKEAGRMIKGLRVARELQAEGKEVTLWLGSGMIDTKDTYEAHPKVVPQALREEMGRVCHAYMIEFLQSPEMQAAFPDMSMAEIAKLQGLVQIMPDVKSANTQFEARFALGEADKFGLDEIIAVTSPEHDRTHGHLVEERARMLRKKEITHSPELSLRCCERWIRPDRLDGAGNPTLGKAAFEDQHQNRDNVKVEDDEPSKARDPIYMGRATWIKGIAFLPEAGDPNYRRSVLEHAKGYTDSHTYGAMAALYEEIDWADEARANNRGRNINREGEGR